MTATTPYRECFLYVDAEGVAQVAAELSHRLGPPQPFDRFVVPGFEIDVVKNDRQPYPQSDDFVYWSTKVDVYADSPSDAEVVRFVTELMTFLRFQGHRVVAACDFEDELPQTDLG
jgi:hypothetical protein